MAYKWENFMREQILTDILMLGSLYVIFIVALCIGGAIADSLSDRRNS